MDKSKGTYLVLLLEARFSRKKKGLSAGRGNEFLVLIDIFFGKHLPCNGRESRGLAYVSSEPSLLDLLPSYILPFAWDCPLGTGPNNARCASGLGWLRCETAFVILRPKMFCCWTVQRCTGSTTVVMGRSEALTQTRRGREGGRRRISFSPLAHHD